jgi:ATP-dependent helicase/nuclease subunit A
MESRNDLASLWISASAGTGKTKSLVDRIVTLLLRGVQPSKILCLTYTKAAASEMLIRLTDYLTNLCNASDKELLVRISSLGFDESSASIARSLSGEICAGSWVSVQTIHSFCFSLLERFPLETGLYPRIKLCNAYQRQELMTKAINHVLMSGNSNLEMIAPYVTNLIDVFDTGLMDISRYIDKCSFFLQLYGEFFGVDEKLMRLDTAKENTLLLERIFSGRYQEVFIELADILSLGSPSDVKNAEILRRNASNPTEEFSRVFLVQNGEIRTRLCSTDIGNPQLIAHMRWIAAKAQMFLEMKKCVASARINAAFFEIMGDVVRRFRELKAASHCLDFDDVIVRALDLLKNIDWVMYKTDSSFDHVLIDEAQDTSSEQWEVIRALTGEFFSSYRSDKTVFIVGDRKQSIYSFQGADVKLFEEMHSYFRENSKGCGQTFHDIVLNRSYRATGNILSFIDRIFADKFPGVSHLTNRSLNSGVVEVVDPFDEEGKDDKKSRNLPSYVANLIKKCLLDKVFVASKNRAANASDFLILFQRRDMSAMKSIINALRKEDIPVTGIDKIPLGEELIVEDLIVLAEFCVFPLDDLMCARVLKSPIIGITEEELMRVCLARKDKRLWSYLKENYPQLQSYVDMAFTYSAYEFFMRILTDEVRGKFVERLGEQCLEMLHEFLSIVIHYEDDNLSTLQNFLEWFRSFDHEVKRESFADRDAVRLMTVHAAKGLQAPFVILADCHYVHSKISSNILKTQEGLLLWDFSCNCRPEKIKQIVASKQKDDEEEFFRLLYVAMTRAEDFLYILAERKKEKSWYNYICDKMPMLGRENGLLLIETD